MQSQLSLDNSPKNVLVIENTTDDYVRVLKNGVPWPNEKERSPLYILPHQMITISHATARKHERVVLEVFAPQGFKVGDLVGEKKMWSKKWTLELGRNKPAHIVVKR